MGEKAKTVIMDVLKSDEMRAFLKEMLHEQTEEIVSTINSTSDFLFMVPE